MKLLRFGIIGEEKPGAIDSNGIIRGLSSIINDLNGQSIDDLTLERLRKINLKSLPAVSNNTRIGPCIGSVGKFLSIGLNYSDHAAETGLPIPEHPILFLKATSSIIGPNDTVYMPRGSTKSDWEVELGVIIGIKAKYV